MSDSACDCCALLRKRVEHLEKELGIRRRDQEIAAVVNRLEVSATRARLLLRLYAAGGKLVSKESLMQVASSLSEGSMRTTICKIRSQLGDDVIISSPFGEKGYALTPKGLSLMLAAIEPVEVQEVRGLV